MIKSITLNNVACYKHSTTLNTDKYVNLIYGLNGSGKSTLSKYLKNLDGDEYSSCSIEGLDENQEILVYNTEFIQENFYESPLQNGIFTLSKENKNIEEQITQAKNIIDEETKALNSAQEALESAENNKQQKNNTLASKVWEIKTNYSGGDRVLEFCLDGLKSNKNNLLYHLLGIQKTSSAPTDTIESLKETLQSITGENAQKYSILDEILLNVENVETNSIFQKVIVGNENSSVSALITELKNSDWVNQGLQYLPAIEDEAAICPFCQQKTITSQLAENLKSYFDESYKRDLSLVKNLQTKYNDALQLFPSKEIYESNPMFEPYKKDFELQYSKLSNLLKQNQKKIEEKIGTPSVAISLDLTSETLTGLNAVIQQINAKIIDHNDSIDQIDQVRKNIKAQFWQIMRWHYDSDIVAYNTEIQQLDTEIQNTKDKIKNAALRINTQKNAIVQLQKQTVNIDEAIGHINTTLLNIGVTGFQIEKDEEIFYKITRDEKKENVFISLSEGEKMIISFLYFIELCKGKKSSSEIDKKKIIVIDDPMSSLSSIYVYNIGQIIKDEIINRKTKKGKNIFEQIFILTHSLYFFYEISDAFRCKDKDKGIMKCFRFVKNTLGTEINVMQPQEIQNEYQAYWSVIRDKSQEPALIANCMRHIIEYFFGFVEKIPLSECFNKEKIRDNVKFRSFYRFINRESHSEAQNIYDYKEFDYEEIRNAFRDFFINAGYEPHYNKMYGA